MDRNRETPCFRCGKTPTVASITRGPIAFHGLRYCERCANILPADTRPLARPSPDELAGEELRIREQQFRDATTRHSFPPDAA